MNSTSSTIETINSEILPPVLIEAITILLDDPDFQVCKVAGIALHSLQMSSEKSLAILEKLLHSDSNVDRWIAAQCLTLANKYDHHIISELIDQLVNSEDNLIVEKASSLLTMISGHTVLNELIILKNRFILIFLETCAWNAGRTSEYSIMDPARSNL